MEEILEDCVEDIFLNLHCWRQRKILMDQESHSLNHMHMKRHQQVQSLLQSLHQMQVAVAVAVVVVREHNTL